MRKFNWVVCTILVVCTVLYAKFGQAPKNWGDIRFGLVSNGVPYNPDDASTFDTHRLKVATEELGIKIHYRYRYVNEGVDAASNACANLFPKKWNFNYSHNSKKDAGVAPAYVIYVLQEEGGRIKLLKNMADPDKMQKFFNTLRIVAENAKGYQSVIVVEPDTWGYLLQDHYQTEEVMSIETDPLKIPAVVNNIPDTTYEDTVIVIPDPSKPWETKMEITTKPLSFDYLSDLPNNMSGFGRAMIRTLHKYAPDCYVGFLASHWSVNLGLDGKGWSDKGMVWASEALIDTSAKINIEFFKKFYYGSIDADHPVKEGDLPDFIGVEKNGWCAGRWEMKDGRTNWYWTDEHMRNYLKWVKQIGQGLDLPVLGWQISIGNMGNSDTEDFPQMANSFRDTFFPYFFKHVDEFVDAGFIGFLVGKGLSQGTDYTLPSENIGEKGWFLSNLQKFDEGRPYLDTSGVPVMQPQKETEVHPALIAQKSNSFRLSQIEGEHASVTVYSLRGQKLKQFTAKSGELFSLNSLAPASYILQVNSGGIFYSQKILIR